MAVSLKVLQEIFTELRQETMCALLRTLDWVETSSVLDPEYEAVRDESTLLCLQTIDTLLEQMLAMKDSQVLPAIDLFSIKDNLLRIANFLDSQYTFDVALYAVKILCRIFSVHNIRVRKEMQEILQCYLRKKEWSDSNEYISIYMYLSIYIYLGK